MINKEGGWACVLFVPQHMSHMLVSSTINLKTKEGPFYYLRTCSSQQFIWFVRIVFLVPTGLLTFKDRCNIHAVYLRCDRSMALLNWSLEKVSKLWFTSDYVRTKFLNKFWFPSYNRCLRDLLCVHPHYWILVSRNY